MKHLIKAAKILLPVIALIALTACGGKSSNNIAKVKPDRVEISGNLSDYLQVVDGEYEVNCDYLGQFSIKLKAIKPLSEEELKNNDFNLSTSLLSENGMPVSGIDEFTMESGSNDKLLGLLKKGSGEEVIEFTGYLRVNDDKAKEDLADKLKKFTVSSTMKEKETTSTSSGSSDNSASSSETTASTDNNNTASDASVDDMIKSYRDFIDQYITLMKKAKAGDASAMSDYADMLQKAQDLQQKLDDVKGDMTPTQAGKLLKLETKLANVAVEISK